MTIDNIPSNTIAIIGAGWLGQPLAQQLISHNQTVYATCRTSESLAAIEGLSIPHFQLSLNEQQSDSNQQLVTDLLQRDIKVVIGAFPPGFRQGGGKGYARCWSSLVNSCKEAGIEKIVMISSTTVYADQCSTMHEADSSLALAQDNTDFSDKSRIMLTAEQSVIDSGISYVILRCSGLFGPKRHPARFVNKLTSISSIAPVNMVHLNDVINAIEYSLTQVNNQIFNVTTPTTVNKFEFYKRAVELYDQGLNMPPQNSTNTKKISADKIVAAGFRFRYNNVLDGLPHC